MVMNYNTNAITGWSSLSSVIGNLKATSELRWANPLELKNAVERAFTRTFGPKDAAPKAKPKEVKKDTSKSTKETTSMQDSTTTNSVFEQGFLGSLHKPGGNPQFRARKMEIEWTVAKFRSPPKRRLIGELGDIIVH